MTTVNQLTITKYEGGGAPSSSFPTPPIQSGAIYFDTLNAKYYRYTGFGVADGWTLMRNIINVAANPVTSPPMGATTDDLVIFNNALYIYNNVAWTLISSTVIGANPVKAVTSAGSTTISLAPNGISNSYLAQSPAFTLKGNNTSSGLTPSDLTVAQANAMLTGIVYKNTASQILALPASSYAGALYMASDTGILYKSVSGSWVNVNASAVTTLKPDGLLLGSFSPNTGVVSLVTSAGTSYGYSNGFTLGSTPIPQSSLAGYTEDYFISTAAGSFQGLNFAVGDYLVVASSDGSTVYWKNLAASNLSIASEIIPSFAVKTSGSNIYFGARIDNGVPGIYSVGEYGIIQNTGTGALASYVKGAIVQVQSTVNIPSYSASTPATSFSLQWAVIPPSNLKNKTLILPGALSVAGVTSLSTDLNLIPKVSYLIDSKFTSPSYLSWIPMQSYNDGNLAGVVNGNNNNWDFSSGLAGYSTDLASMAGYTPLSPVSTSASTALTLSMTAMPDGSQGMAVTSTAAVPAGTRIKFPTISVPGEFRGKNLKLEVFHQILSGITATGTYGTDNLSIFGYDAANNSLLTPIGGSANLFNAVLNNGVTGVAGGFPLGGIYIPPTCSSFYLMIIFSVATAGAVSFKIGKSIIKENVALLPTGAIVGQIITTPAKTPPSGYLYCNGAAVSRTAYPELFSVIGTTHGSGDGSTTFNLPDFRGRFIRGVNDGSGNDPDASARVVSNTGGSTGDSAGSYQGDQVISHSHGINMYSGAGAGTIPASAGSGSFSLGSSNSTGGNETRPKNVSEYYHICYTALPQGLAGGVVTDITAIGYLTNNIVQPTGGDYDLPGSLWTITTNSGGAWDTINNRINITRAGIGSVSFTTCYGAPNTPYYKHYRNGTMLYQHYGSNNVNGRNVITDTAINLQVGDYITFGNNGAANNYLYSTPINTFFSFTMKPSVLPYLGQGNITGNSPINVSSSSSSASVVSLAANGVDNSYLAQSPAFTLKGNSSASTANASDLTVAQANAMLTGIVYGSSASQILALNAPNYSGAFYMASDTGILYKSNGTTWINVNSIGASLNKNYLANYNGNFETGLAAPWYTVTVPLTSGVPSGAPVTGASSITVLAAVSASLAGSYSLQMTASTALAAGAGFSSPPIALDTQDQGKLLSVKGYFKPSAGIFNLTSSSPTLQAWIWDIANSKFISLVNPNVFNSGSSTISGMINGQFQAPVNMSAFQLVIVCVNSTSAAVTMLFDDLAITPQAPAITGAFISDWSLPVSIPFTNVTVGTTRINQFSYRREGDSLRVRGELFTTGAGSSAGISDSNPVQVLLPNGLQADTSKITPSNKLASAKVGEGHIKTTDDVGSQDMPRAITQLFSSTTLAFAINQNTNSSMLETMFWFGPAYNPAQTGMGIEFDALIPISGWSSGMTLSSQVPQGKVYLDATFNGNTVSGTGLDFNSIDSESTISSWIKYTGGEWRLVAPYEIVLNCSCTMGGTGSSTVNLQLYKIDLTGNAASKGYFTGTYLTQSNFTSGSKNVSLRAGEAITIRPDANGNGNSARLTVSAFGQNQTIATTPASDIELLSTNNPTVTTDTVPSTGNIVVFNVISSSRGGAINYNTSTGIGTVAHAGKYLFTGFIEVAKTTPDFATWMVAVLGGVTKTFMTSHGATSGINQCGTILLALRMSAGDTFTFQARPSEGSAVTGNSNAQVTRLSD